MGEMQEQPDVQLLRDYAANADEAAFREIVARYTDLVYSAALRQVSSSVLAREIAQNVFTDLARKARPLAAGRSAWPGEAHSVTCSTHRHRIAPAG